MRGWPGDTSSAFGDEERGRGRERVVDVLGTSSPTTVMRRAFSSSSIRTTPLTRASGAAPLGVRASKSSTTRGRPWVMSAPATPPPWKVRMVSWVPGSPIDWAAMVPTASPSSMWRPVASEKAVALRAHALWAHSHCQHRPVHGCARPRGRCAAGLDLGIYRARGRPGRDRAVVSASTRPYKAGVEVGPPTWRRRKTTPSTQTPWVVPQSSSRMMSSWATSWRRRVRYPESAVRSAVSARPLRARGSR